MGYNSAPGTKPVDMTDHEIHEENHLPSRLRLPGPGSNGSAGQERGGNRDRIIVQDSGGNAIEIELLFEAKVKSEVLSLRINLVN